MERSLLTRLLSELGFRYDTTWDGVSSYHYLEDTRVFKMWLIEKPHVSSILLLRIQSTDASSGASATLLQHKYVHSNECLLGWAGMLARWLQDGKGTLPSDLWTVAMDHVLCTDTDGWRVPWIYDTATIRPFAPALFLPHSLRYEASLTKTSGGWVGTIIDRREPPQFPLYRHEGKTLEAEVHLLLSEYKSLRP